MSFRAIKRINNRFETFELLLYKLELVFIDKDESSLKIECPIVTLLIYVQIWFLNLFKSVKILASQEKSEKIGGSHEFQLVACQNLEYFISKMIIENLWLCVLHDSEKLFLRYVDIFDLRHTQFVSNGSHVSMTGLGTFPTLACLLLVRVTT